MKRHSPRRPQLWPTLGLAALGLLFPLGAASSAFAASADNMHLKIVNNSDQAVKAKVFKGSGELQKSETVKAGKTHRFKFKWCYNCCGHDKTRTYELWDGGTKIASGTLEMNTKKVYTGDGPGGTTICQQSHDLTINDESEAFTFKEDSENSGRTAVIKVKND